jgi:hypothetical protein
MGRATIPHEYVDSVDRDDMLDHVLLHHLISLIWQSMFSSHKYMEDLIRSRRHAGISKC